MADTNEKKKKKIDEENTECENANDSAAETEAGAAVEDTGNQADAENADGGLKAELERMKDKMMRHAAEFDNYKKRTAKERDELYAMGVCDTVEKILPVRDNLERAVTAADGAGGGETLADGVKMILKQLDDVLSAIGVEAIKTVGETFDPEKHNAVMHEENGEYGENTVSEELMKGYMYKDKVVRHSMVKVAN